MIKKILNKKLVSFLVMLLLFIIAAACASEKTLQEQISEGLTEVSIEITENTSSEDWHNNKRKEPKWMNVSKTAFEISSPSTEIKLNIVNDGLYVTSIKNPEADVEWILGEGSKVELPDCFYDYPPNDITSDISQMTRYDVSWKLVDTFVGADNEKALKFTFKCNELNITLDSIWQASGEDGPVQHTMNVNNGTDMNLVILSTQSFKATLDASLKPEIWQFRKESSKATLKGVYISKPLTGVEYNSYTKTSETDGVNGFIPVIYLNCNDDHGMYVAWEWSHGRVMAEKVDDPQTVNDTQFVIQAGFNDDFKTVIESGSTFLIPTAYIGTYNGDVDNGGNIFKSWFYNNKAPSFLTKDENEPLTEIRETENMLSYVKAENFTEETGLQSILWGYGWWSDVRIGPTNRIWRTREGSFTLQNSALISSITPYSELGEGENSLMENFGKYLEDNGISFAVHYPLKDSELDEPGVLTSVGQYGHPEWFTDRIITIGRSADLGNEECVNWLKNKLCGFFTTTYIKTWRSDFEPISYNSPNINRHKFTEDVSYWCSVGFYDLLDYLYENTVGFRYECCSSGGSLKDYATLSRSAVIQCDDLNEANNARTVFYASSYVIHPSQLMMMSSLSKSDPNSSEYVGPGDILFALRSTMLGVPCLITGLADPVKTELISTCMKLYNERIKPLQKNGDLYHILPRPDNVHWDGMEYYYPESDTGTVGVVFLFKPTDTEGSSKTIKLKGLDDNTLYSMEFTDRPEQNFTATGAELKNGFAVTIEGDYGSELIFINSAN